MIDYFIKVSTGESGDIFRKYVWSFRKLINEYINITKYSDDVDLLLIEFSMEGKFIEYPKKEIRFRSYRLKEKSAAVTVGVRKEFIEWTDNEKKQFIITSTLNSIELARNALRKKGLDISGFPRLLVDLNDCFDKNTEMKIQ
jgi:hypothetical protein